MSNVSLVYNRLLQHGMPAHQAAGLVGRFQQESGQNLNTKAVGDSGISLGIGQWNKDRRANLMNFAKNQNKDWADPTTQADFAVWEMTKGPERFAGNMLMKARNTEEAAKAAMHFERPQGYTRDSPESGHGYSNTLRNANNIAGLISDPKSAPGQPPTVGSGLSSFAPTVSGMTPPANPNATPTLPVQPNLGWTPLPSASGAMSPSGFNPSPPTATAAPEKSTADKVTGLLDSLGSTVGALTGKKTGGTQSSEPAMQPMNSGFSSEQAARAQAAAQMMAQIMARQGMPKQPGLI